MRLRHEAGRRRLVATVALASLLWAALALPAAASPAEDGSGGPAVGVASTEVRLLTGDLVTVRAFPDGHEGIEVDLAERSGGEAVSYEILRHDAGTYVIPSDAWPLLPETLDPELFNVTKLVEYGYDTGRGLPVIAAPASPGARARAAGAPRGEPEPPPPGTTELVSVASDGTQANRGHSAPPVVSADGRYVAFASLATNLVPGDATITSGVYVRDLETGTTERVSVASDGTPASGSSSGVALSADGRYVAFTSTAPELVPEKTTTWRDVFVHDRETGETVRVSVASDGTEGDSGASSSGLSVSADGRYVAFASYASNLVPGDTNGSQDVFVHDRETGETVRASVASDGTEIPRFTGASEPGLNADGRLVVFESSAANLVPDDTNNSQDVFVRDLETGTTERVSIASDGAEADQSASNPALSADGRYVVFASYAANLVLGDTNGWSDVFVHDRQTGETTRVSVATDGTQADTAVLGSALSADGRYVGFGSRAANLVPGDTNGAFDLFLHDRYTGATERVSVAQDGTEANSGSTSAFRISADGAYVAFMSGASNLVPADTNGQSDIFVRYRGEE